MTTPGDVNRERDAETIEILRAAAAAEATFADEFGTEANHWYECCREAEAKLAEVAAERAALVAENARLRMEVKVLEDQAGYTADERLQCLRGDIKTLEFAARGTEAHVRAVEAECDRLRTLAEDRYKRAGKAIELALSYKRDYDTLAAADARLRAVADAARPFGTGWESYQGYPPDGQTGPNDATVGDWFRLRDALAALDAQQPQKE